MFLSPIFLIAAAVGATIPLVLHLMQNKRKVLQSFPTLRFLKLAQKSSSRRIRMENFLLWLLRTIIMLLLGMAFAMPMIRKSGLGWLGDAPRDVAIVIDTSYSMSYSSDRSSIWDEGIEAAIAIIDGLSDNGRYCIYLAKEQPEALIAQPIADKQQGIDRLKALQPASGSSQLGPAMIMAMNTLLNVEKNTEREIHVITDNQATPWQSLSSQTIEIDDEIAVFVSTLGVPSPSNSGVASVEITPPVVRSGSPVKVTASMMRAGTKAETTATLFLDGEEIARRAVVFDDPDQAIPRFALPPLEVGIHTGRIETPEDSLLFDNTFHFIIQVQDRMPSLIVGDEQETLFLRTALRTSFGDQEPIESITPNQLTEKSLTTYACIFLCNALPLSGQAIGALEDYVAAGGVLVLFPGNAAKASDYTAWSILPGVPSMVEDLALAHRSRILSWDQPQHPLVSTLREGESAPRLAVRRRLVWNELHEEAARVLSMGPEEGFLIERELERGRVLMMAVSAERTWSDFPLSPFFLPLVVQVADYGSGVGAKPPYLWAQESLLLETIFPGISQPPTITDPEGKSIPIRSTLVEGKTVLSAEEIMTPGIHTVITVEQPDTSFSLAVNQPRSDSDLTIIETDQMASLLGNQPVGFAEDLPALRQLITDHRIGRTYGEHLLWAVLILLAFEFIYANRLMHKSTTKTESLTVDAAGHLEKTSHAPSVSKAEA
ncbi:MAG: BatA and WFA domain-containing protein [Verrucomicrobiota bacterium]